ncbi:hypothetical protein, variant [Aphanomyces invadans]|uniref:EF-hand domain-containing protein n=1 Tax=Aphanomyces invadans TaxID=157072 RepID=A0A024TRK1_9STRA|nr:hypothetical protein, variant [Aphanomyces invadans]ETV96634.1 hypothetical protein, variant [Aphanomyces invadans]|eukprot:XP_008874897.1 hypothetical protein, variant [Aphanomyces invadans]
MEPDKAVIDFVTKASRTDGRPGVTSSPSTEPSLFHVLHVHEQPPILKRTIPTPHYAKDLLSPPKSRLNFYLDQRQQVQTLQPSTPPTWSPVTPGTPRPITVSSSPREKAAAAAPRVVHIHGREHLEVRACMLAHRYRLNVDELVKSRDDHRQAVAGLKQQRHATLLPNTAIAQETARRKTQFLLDHYFGMHEGTDQPPLPHPTGSSRPSHKTGTSWLPSPKMSKRLAADAPPHSPSPRVSDAQHVLLDVVDEWSLHADASTSDVESFWHSVTAHMEASYVLQTTVVDAAHPNTLAVQIALDCLAKLADRLPSYARLLHVIHVVLERAVYAPEETPSANASTKPSRRQLFVDKLAETQASLDRYIGQVSAFKASQKRTPLEKIADVVASTASETERHELLLNVIGQHLPQSTLGMDVVMAAATHASPPDQIRLVQSVLAHRSVHDMQSVLLMMHQRHKQALPMFMEDHADAMEALILDDGGRGVQRVMEANGTFFSDLFLRAPALLNNALQAPTPLLGQVVEQNRSAISNILSQKPDVFLQVLASALKDNNLLALEEYLVKTPKALRDVLLNRPTLLSGVVKSSPSILTDVLVNAKAVFARVVTEVPDHLTAVFNAHPASIGTMFAASGETLAPILDQCPQVLSGYLESAPETVLDIAHRSPKLVSMLFSRFPDLLLEPLELNPTILATFLASHQDILKTLPIHDFVDASGSSRFRKLGTAATQTETTVAMQKQVANGAAKLKKRNNVLMQIIKKRKVNAMPEADVLKEISKLYAKKIVFDDIDDRAGLDRYSLAELSQDIYVQEFGLKSTAQKRIASLVAGLKKIDKDNSRARWFSVLLGATAELYNAQAIDVYLQALQLMVPPGDVEARLGDGSTPCLIPLHTAKDLALHAYDSSISMDVRLQLQKRIVGLPTEAHVTADGSPVAASPPSALDEGLQMFVNLDDVMDCVMSMWYEYQTNIDKEMTKLFAEADEDGNGVLTYQEFESMIKKVDADCDDRTIMRIFNMCGEENDQGEHEIKPSDFATVMRAYHVNNQDTGASSTSAASAPQA